MAHYAFVTRWRFEAPIESVWESIRRAEEWPTWWRGVERVEVLEPGGHDGVGGVRRFTWKSRLPYRLVLDVRTVAADRPRRLEGHAAGELEGVGVWTLLEDRGWTKVRYDWSVRTTKPWMNLLAPVARPLFAWNHDVIMRWGGEGLAGRLGCAWRDAGGGPD
jgi:hypothetical protein